MAGVGDLTMGADGGFETGSDGATAESAGAGDAGTGTGGGVTFMDGLDEIGALTGGGGIVAGASLFNGVGADCGGELGTSAVIGGGGDGIVT